MRFKGLPRAILVAISTVSGDSAGDINGEELSAASEPSTVTRIMIGGKG